MKFFFLKFALIRFNLNKNKLSLKKSIIGIFMCFFLLSCDRNEPGDNQPMPVMIDVPDTYSFTRNGQTTVAFPGQKTRIDMANELVNAMSNPAFPREALVQMYTNMDAEGGDVDPFQNADLNLSEKSIKSKVAASRDFFFTNTAESSEIKTQIEDWIVEQAETVFPNATQFATAGEAGQIKDGTTTRYLNAHGLELKEVVKNALAGALMADQMVNNYLSPAILDEANNEEENNQEILTDGENYTTMEHKWDEAYGYLFADSANTSDPLEALYDADYSFLHYMTARVNEDNDFSNMAPDIFDAFALGRAAIVENEYEIRDQQAEIIKLKIARIYAVETVHQLQQGILALQEGNDANAYHHISQAYGLIYGLRFLRKPNTPDPYFTNNQLSVFLSHFTDDLGVWGMTTETLEQLSSNIAIKFNFTPQQAIE